MNSTQVSDPPTRGVKRNRIFIGIWAGVLVVALAISAILLLSNSPDSAQRIVNFGRVMSGVRVNGVDISGMTQDEALSATANVPEALLGTVQIPLDVNGEIHTCTAEELRIRTDYENIIAHALAYGRTGTFDERLQAAEAAKEKGTDFAVSLTADETELRAALAELKTALDRDPINAQAVFTPWGHYADGTPYAPDPQELIKLASKGKAIAYPEELVRFTDAEMPSSLRYQYWQNDHYEKNYHPDAASISRFVYTAEQTGIITDMDAIAAQVTEQISSGTFSTITVPVQVTEPTAKLDQIKAQTQLITSWTSSYSTHNNANRNWNVAKMSGIVCGVTIDPSIQWSINERAGARTVASGWKLASGITDGAYVDQPGGGVCQISSTLFNAAIRAGLGTQSKHHSIVSGYMPKGLDATISTGGPDLKLTNPYATPVYIVSYMTPKDKTVTVEIYGAPITDPATGAGVIYDFESGDPSFYGSPTMQFFFNQATLPDGTPIAAGASKVYSQNEQGMKVTTHKIFYKPDGTKYNEAVFETVNINPINGKTYCNYPDPATVVPTPAPQLPTETPAPDASVTG